VHVLFATAPSVIDHIQSGKLRAFAVTTTTRAEVLPQLPPIADFVPGYEASQWYGMAAPAKTPPETVEKLNREINAAIADPAMKAHLTALGGEVLPGPPSAFGKLIADDTDKWAKVVRAAGLKPH
jgi:tripartite-type tricarboxylate transporter receptor subunit TctC